MPTSKAVCISLLLTIREARFRDGNLWKVREKPLSSVLPASPAHSPPRRALLSLYEAPAVSSLSSFPLSFSQVNDLCETRTVYLLASFTESVCSGLRYEDDHRGRGKRGKAEEKEYPGRRPRRGEEGKG